MNISTSLICMNLANIEKDISHIMQKIAEDQRFHWLHADFMDGRFVPRLGISPELIRDIKITFPDIHIDSHLMIDDPFTYVDVIAPYSDWVVYHYEAVSDPIRTLQKIRKTWPNVKVGLAINLITAFNPEMISLFDGIMFMGISPGVLGTNSYPEIVKGKIAITPYNKHYFVDGSVNFNTIRDYSSINPNGTLICGSSTIFKKDEFTENLNRKELIEYNINRIKDALECKKP